MSTSINTFQADHLAHNELGLVVPTGCAVRLKNLGPAPVFLHDWYAGNTDAVGAHAEGNNGWPLNVGEEITVLIPTYPVAADTWVPALTSVTRDSTIAYMTVSEAN